MAVSSQKPTVFEMCVDLLKSSVVTQGIIVAVFGIGTFMLLLTDRPIPEWLQVFLGVIIGFYFGGRLMQKQLESQVQVAQAQLQTANDIAESKGGNPNATP